jgi:hypothetical protein
MVNRIAAVALLFAGGALAAIGTIALVMAPPVAFDSRDQLVVALALAGLLFAGLGGRAVIRIS